MPMMHISHNDPARSYIAGMAVLSVSIGLSPDVFLSNVVEGMGGVCSLFL